MPRKSLYYSRLSFFFISHGRALRDSIVALRQKPLAFLITTIALAIIIALPVVLYSLLHIFQRITSQWDSKPSVSLYLKEGASATQVQRLIAQARKYPAVAQVTYISPEQGLKDLNHYIEFSSVTSLLKDNPLPAVINLRFSNAHLKQQSINELLKTFQHAPLVDQVSADMAWIQRLQYILITAKRIILTLSILLASAMILVVSNTVRLTAQAHHRETQILRLLGASRYDIQRPFLYHGLVYGGCGALLAWMLSGLTLLWITPPLFKLVASHGQSNTLSATDWSSGLFIIVAAVLLSVVGSWLATRHVFCHYSYSSD